MPGHAGRAVYPKGQLQLSHPPDESRDLPTLFAMMEFVAYEPPPSLGRRVVLALLAPLAWVFDGVFRGLGWWVLRRRLGHRRGQERL